MSHNDVVVKVNSQELKITTPEVKVTTSWEDAFTLTFVGVLISIFFSIFFGVWSVSNNWRTGLIWSLVTTTIVVLLMKVKRIQNGLTKFVK